MAGPPADSAWPSMSSTFLLQRLNDPNDQAVWEQFVQRYRPMIVRYGRRVGLREEDAQDAAQQTLAAFFTAYRAGKYQREKGRLRHWLFGIARNHVKAVFPRRQHREVDVTNRPGQTDFFKQVPADDDLERVWEQEWQDAVLRQAMAQVRVEFDTRAIQAFELVTKQGLPARQAAEQVGMTANAVAIAKHKILKRIRQLLAEME